MGQLLVDVVFDAEHFGIGFMAVRPLYRTLSLPHSLGFLLGSLVLHLSVVEIRGKPERLLLCSFAMVLVPVELTTFTLLLARPPMGS